MKWILRKYGYPPDFQENATQTVLEQADVLSAQRAAMAVIRLIGVHWWNEGASGGFSYYRSEPEARAAIREVAPDPSGKQDTLEVIEIEPSVDGILDALWKYASHPDLDPCDHRHCDCE